MPSLETDPLHLNSNPSSDSTPSLPPLATDNTTYHSYESAGVTSPVAPEFSPITPKILPVLPATYPPPGQYATPTEISPVENEDARQQPTAIAPTAEYIPQPPPQPFSSEDSTDAIALRAAISSLQFQKKKAQDDIKKLEDIRKKALDDPTLFKSQLAAGNLKEQRPSVGNLQAILDQSDSEDEDEEVVLGASEEDSNGNGQQETTPRPVEMSDAHASHPDTSTSPNPGSRKNDAASFDRIPGPQNVIRMPYVNWDKYHVVGDALDSMHEQQRRWPGSFGYGQPKGREYAVSASYSPWHDSLDGQQADERKDSLATPISAATPTVSEHPMETRRAPKSMYP